MTFVSISHHFVISEAPRKNCFLNRHCFSDNVRCVIIKAVLDHLTLCYHNIRCVISKGTTLNPCRTTAKMSAKNYFWINFSSLSMVKQIIMRQFQLWKIKDHMHAAFQSKSLCLRKPEAFERKVNNVPNASLLSWAFYTSPVLAIDNAEYRALF